MIKKANGGAILLLLLIILLIWGYLGAQEAKKIGVTCDIGFKDIFCWKWHKNIIGEVGEAVESFLKIRE